METTPFREAQQSKLLGTGVEMREVEPQRNVSCASVSTAGGEADVDGAETLSDGGGPPEEHVGDYADRWPAFVCGDVGDQFADRSFKTHRGVEELSYFGWRDVLGIVGVRREAMVRAVERKVGEVDLR